MGVFMQLKIKELREENGLTQKKLAELLGNAQRNVSNWESGASEPDCETIVKLADVFGVTIDELFGREPTDAPPTFKHSTLPDIFFTLSDSQLHAVVELVKSLRR